MQNTDDNVAQSSSDNVVSGDSGEKQNVRRSGREVRKPQRLIETI